MQATAYTVAFVLIASGVTALALWPEDMEEIERISNRAAVAWVVAVFTFALSALAGAIVLYLKLK